MTSKIYSKKQLAVILLLFLFMIVQELISIRSNSLTSDETLYIGAGKEIFETGNLRSIVVMAHPPLSYYIGSIFLIPLKFDRNLWEYDDWNRGQNLIFHSGYDPDLIIFLSRIPFILLSCFVAIYVLKWASELYGVKSGLAALFFYSLNPSIIAYSGIATTDFTPAAMMFISMYYFWKLVKEPAAKHLVLTGIFTGLALLSKITAILLILIFLVIYSTLIFKNYSKLRLKIFSRNILIILLISYFLIFSFYGFQFDTLSNALPKKFYVEKTRNELSKFTFSEPLIYIYENVPIPTPSYFAEIGYLFFISGNPNPGYLFGKITQNVVWYYVYVTFIIKTSVPFLIFLLLLLVFRKKLPKKDLVSNLALWLPVLIIFVNFSVTNKISGVRHILAVYLFMSVSVSNVVNAKIRAKRAYNFILLALLSYYAASSLLISPDYMAYINELGGGPANGHKIVVGSNIDHGQDLFRLKQYMDKNEIKKIKLSYFGQADPKGYNISYEYLPVPSFLVWAPDYTFLSLKEREEDCSRKTGYLAISITNLENVHLVNKTCFNWLKERKIDQRIGYSIFFYNITS